MGINSARNNIKIVRKTVPAMVMPIVVTAPSITVPVPAILEELFDRKTMAQKFGSVGMINRLHDKIIENNLARKTAPLLNGWLSITALRKRMPVPNTVPSPQDFDAGLKLLQDLKKQYENGKNVTTPTVYNPAYDEEIDFKFGKYGVRLMGKNNTSIARMSVSITKNPPNFTIAEMDAVTGKDIETWTDVVYYKNTVDEKFTELIFWSLLHDHDFLKELLTRIENR